jgi:ferritin-like metal-binding protein YciE
MTHLKPDLLRALRDACAMERHAEWLLRSHVAATTLYPEVNERIDADLTATLANQKALAGCMERIEGTDGSDAILPTLPDDIAGAIETGSIAQTAGELVRNLAILMAFKRYEIASYTALIAAAEASGFFETKFTCEGILSQQIAMADWLFECVPSNGDTSAGRVRPSANAAPPSVH